MTRGSAWWREAGRKWEEVCDPSKWLCVSHCLWYFYSLWSYHFILLKYWPAMASSDYLYRIEASIISCYIRLKSGWRYSMLCGGVASSHCLTPDSLKVSIPPTCRRRIVEITMTWRHRDISICWWLTSDIFLNIVKLEWWWLTVWRYCILMTLLLKSGVSWWLAIFSSYSVISSVYFGVSLKWRKLLWLCAAGSNIFSEKLI
jgi:hypothetical protein